MLIICKRTKNIRACSHRLNLSNVLLYRDTMHPIRAAAKCSALIWRWCCRSWIWSLSRSSSIWRVYPM